MTAQELEETKVSMVTVTLDGEHAVSTWKQRDDGSFFICSPVPLSSMEELVLTGEIDLSEEDLAGLRYDEATGCIRSDIQFVTKDDGQVCRA